MDISINTFARLDMPAQFRPSEKSVFCCYYSNDLSPNYVTLIIDGGHYGYDKLPYHKTQYANSIIGGVRYEEFNIDPNSLGTDIPDSFYSTPFSGKIKAKVVFHTTQTNYDSPIFSSNEITVPLYLAPSRPIWWGTYADKNTPAIVKSSVIEIPLNYRYYCSSISTTGFGEINSYRYYLYNANKKLIYDSGALYDWSSTKYVGYPRKFKGLKNNSVYYYKAVATLVGGYVVESDMETFITDFDNYNVLSDELQLHNNYTSGSVHIETHIQDTHTKIILSRSVKYEEKWIVLFSDNTTTNITLDDYFVLPNNDYVYKIDIYNQDTLVATYYSNIKHVFNGICISDAVNSYCTNIETEKYPINKNERVFYQNTYSPKYPFAIILNNNDYHKSGAVKGAFFGEIDECRITAETFLKGNSEHSKNMLNWLNNGNVKLLKYDDGFSAIVTIDGEPSLAYDSSKKIYINSFAWTEVADCTDIDNFVLLGLSNPISVQHSNGTDINYIGSDNQIIVQDFVVYKNGGIAPNGIKIQATRNENSKSIPNIRIHTKIPSLTGFSNYSNSKKIFVSTQINVLQTTASYQQFQHILLNEDETEYIITTFNNYDNYREIGIGFVWNKIEPPGYSVGDVNFPYGCAVCSTCYRTKSSSNVYSFVINGGNYIFLGFKNIEEYNKAIGKK